MMRKLIIFAPKSVSMASIFASRCYTSLEDMPPLLPHVFIAIFFLELI